MKKNLYLKRIRRLLSLVAVMTLFGVQTLKADDYTLIFMLDSSGAKEYTVFLSEASLGYTGHVNIPSRHDDLPVTKIAPFFQTVEGGYQNVAAFPNISSITIPSSIKEIAYDSFYNNTNLESVTITGEGLNAIGTSAFAGCTNLKEINFPESLRTIGQGAFNSCTSLKEVTIGSNNATEECIISQAAFISCTALEKVVLRSNVHTVETGVFSGCKSLTTLVADGVKTIKGEAFARTGLKSFTTSESLETITGSSFMECNDLTAVTITHNVSVGQYSFYGCANLTSVNLSDDITELGEYVFAQCTALEELHLPALLQQVPKSLISGSGVKRIYIGRNVTSIDANALYTSALEEIHIDAPKPPAIERNTFSSESYEKAMVYCPSVRTYRDNNMWHMFKNYDLSDPGTYTETDGGYAFTYDLDDLTNDMITAAYPDGKLVIPATYNGLPVVEIADVAFYNTSTHKTKLQSCITEIVLPETIRRIGKEAFYYASGITKVNLPASLTEIGNEAFYRTGLREVVLPDVPVTVGKWAFGYDSSLTTVVIPQSVALIGYNAFECGSSLLIKCLGDTPVPLESWIMYSDNLSKCTVQVPFGSLPKYRLDSNWSSICSGSSTMEGIGDHSLAEPVISPDNYTQTGDFTVTIDNPNESGTIKYYTEYNRYTTSDAIVYTGPFTISGNGYWKVYAIIEDGDKCSDVAARDYEIANATQFDTPCDQVSVCGIDVYDSKTFESTFGKNISYTETKDSSILSLYDAEIDAIENKSFSGINAMGGTLVIELNGNSTINASVYGISLGTQADGAGGNGGKLIIRGAKGGESLTINAQDGMGIFGYLADITIDNCTLIINSAAEGIYMKSADGSGILTVQGSDAKVTIDSKGAALSNVTDLILDDELTIIEPVDGYFCDGYVYDDKEPASHIVIGICSGNPIPEQITEEQTTDFGNDLTDDNGNALPTENTVIDNIYYNLASANGDGYDTDEGCVIVNTMVSQQTFADEQRPVAPAEGDSFEWFNGMIIVVGGTGAVNLTYSTTGTATLAVKVGDAKPQVFSSDGSSTTADIDYSTSRPEYVYIYATESTTGKKNASRAAAANSLKIYELKVVPDNVISGIDSITTSPDRQDKRVIYDISGRRCTEPLAPGFYIVNGKKLIIR